MTAYGSNPGVLIVEDEPLIRMMAVDFVEDAGFSTIEAANAEEALASLDNNPDISVLFTDVDMPGPMNGLELARLVHEKWPGISIIVASGYRKTMTGELPDGGMFFQKPYDIDRITAALQTMTSNGSMSSHARM